MTFNTALTGLRAASTSLDITGNNIANASTTGYKSSRAEFSDVYANAVVGGGANEVGNGVRVSDVAQSFSQGSISFTENALDLAINGGGFFVLEDQGSQIFSRAGQFGLDDEGFITSNDGAILQGFPANTSGVVSGVLGDLQLSTSSIAPNTTTAVDIQLNLDASSPVLAERGSEFTSSGAAIQQVNLNLPNGYDASTLTFNGTNYPIPANGLTDQTARLIAADLSAIPGVSATATTEATIQFAGGFPTNPNDFSLNGAQITGTTSVEVAQSINALSGITATENAGVITVTSTNGENLVFNLSNNALATSGITGVDVTSPTTVGPVTLASGGGTSNFATVGGEITLRIDEGTTYSGPIAATDVFISNPATSPFAINTFNAADQNTYNSATSVTIFDSLGTPHVLTQFFVKESDASNPPNTWTMYVQIDGENVGDPDPLAVDPNAATLLGYTLQFNNDGSLDAANTPDLVVSNWTPVIADNNGAVPLGPLPGATIPIPTPAESSNFLIDIAGSTQFTADFAVNDLDQNGFASGQLAGVDIDESGIIFARYSNGEALVLGQVALADFSNEQGLTPLGDTAWAQSFETGEPVIGAPRTASLGSITSGALEESNVELAEELVQLIIAQRNFQANSRTIETANELEQTIINIR